MAVLRAIIGFVGMAAGSLLRALLWLLMPWRWFRRRSPAAVAAAPLARSAEATASPAAEEADWPEMPRVGKPGTATDEQVEALMQLRFLPAPPCRDLHDYSREEAQLFLDAVAFSRAVVSQVTGGEDEEAPPDVLTALLNDMLGEILADDELRSLASRWVRNGSPRPIRENASFERVRAVVLRHWQPAESVNP